MVIPRFECQLTLCLLRKPASATQSHGIPIKIVKNPRWYSFHPYSTISLYMHLLNIRDFRDLILHSFRQFLFLKVTIFYHNE